MVTVALRRVDPGAADGDILDAIDPDQVLLLTNTSGADDAEEAVRLARLARAAGLPTWIKLEITPEPRYLLPDPVETLKAAEILCAEGFTVLPYVNADPVLCKRLEEVGLRHGHAARARGSARTRACAPRGRWRSSSSSRWCRWSSTPASGRRRRPPRPWRWGPTRCSSTPPSAPPATPWPWPPPSAWRSRPAATASWPGCRRRAGRPTPRRRSPASSS